MKRRELESGKHDIWGQGEIEIAVPRHREIKEPTARSILRLAEVENS